MEALVTALDDDNDKAREAAAGALGALGDVRAVEPLVRLGAKHAMLYVTNALDALVDEHAAGPLIRLLQNEDISVAIKAEMLLERIRVPECTAALLPLLDHESRWVRISAIRLLSDRARSTVLPCLTPLLFDQDFNVTRAAAEALRAFGWEGTSEDERAAVAIAGFGELKHNNLEDFCSVVLDLGDPSIAVLRRALESSREKRLHEAAVEALSRLGGELAASALLDRVASEAFVHDWDVRRAAACAVVQVRDRGSLPRQEPLTLDPVAPGAPLFDVRGPDDLRIGAMVRIWHDILNQWATEWLEVRGLVAEFAVLRDPTTGSYDVRDITDAGEVLRDWWGEPPGARHAPAGQDEETEHRFRPFCPLCAARLVPVSMPRNVFGSATVACDQCGEQVSLTLAPRSGQLRASMLTLPAGSSDPGGRVFGADELSGSAGFDRSELEPERLALDELVAAAEAEILPRERARLVRALGRSGDPRAADPLLRLLRKAAQSSDRSLMDKTSRALTDLGALAADVLLTAIDDENPIVRWRVAQLLGETGSTAAVGALGTLHDDSDVGVREAAEVAIERIQHPPPGP